MDGLIIRTYLKDATPGTFVIRDEQGKELLMVETLELPWKQNKPNISCIWPGFYIVKKRYTESRGWHFHVQDVEGRTWILIHIANYVREIRGCIIPGLKHVDMDGDGIIDIARSTDAMIKLLALLPDEFNLEIR